MYEESRLPLHLTFMDTRRFDSGGTYSTSSRTSSDFVSRRPIVFLVLENT